MSQSDLQLANAFKKHDDLSQENSPEAVNSDPSTTTDSLGYANYSETTRTPVDTRSMLSQNQSSDMKKNLKLYLAMGAIAIVAGIGTGYGGFKLQGQSGLRGSSVGPSDIQQVAGSTVSVGDVFGINDADTFGDSAEGYLEAGGIDGEGSHRLLRPGGESQTVYLTSSITDLDPLVGMDVKVHGETFKGQKAGWLMDVGRIEVVKTKGNRPITE